VCLERMKFSWIAGDGELYPQPERTIVDSAREWLDAYAVAHPALAAVLSEGAMYHLADSMTRLWSRATDERVAELRASKAIEVQMHRSHVRRA